MKVKVQGLAPVRRSRKRGQGAWRGTNRLPCEEKPIFALNQVSTRMNVPAISMSRQCAEAG